MNKVEVRFLNIFINRLPNKKMSFSCSPKASWIPSIKWFIASAFVSVFELMIAKTLTSAFRLPRLEWKREKENYKYNLPILKRFVSCQMPLAGMIRTTLCLFVYFLPLLVYADTLKSYSSTNFSSYLCI